MNDTPPLKVFVTDFDGTLAGEDFYNLFVSRLYPRGAPDYWSECVAGRITHFEALRNIFAYAPVGEAAIWNLLKDMRLPADLPQKLAMLRERGWQVVVASAGCRWYIERLLEMAGVSLPIYANGGCIIDNRLVMEMPSDPKFRDDYAGIDKAKIVRSFAADGTTVAFAGDGSTDVAPALAVPPTLRFARGYLADVLRQRREPFQRFQKWGDIADALV